METSLRTAATPRRRVAPRNNERRLTIQHPRRRFLSLAASQNLPVFWFGQNWLRLRDSASKEEVVLL